MKLSKYFTLEELTRSTAAERLGIDNTPPDEVILNLRSLATYTLDIVRLEARRPVIVNSGYRCKDLNKAVGGAKNSQHLSGKAADITVGSRDDNRKLYDFLRSKKSRCPYDQLILENGGAWIHISYNGAANRQMSFAKS